MANSNIIRDSPRNLECTVYSHISLGLTNLKQFSDWIWTEQCPQADHQAIQLPLHHGHGGRREKGTIKFLKGGKYQAVGEGNQVGKERKREREGEKGKL